MNAEMLRDWSLGLFALGASVLLVQVLKALFKRAHRSGWSRVIRELGPTLANFLYVIGVQIFLDVAPLHPKVALWIDSAVYVLGVILLLLVARRGVLILIEWTASRAHSLGGLQHGFITMFRNVLTLFVLIVGAIMILKRFNYDVMSLITALGVGSLAVGLAARDTLSNMISGFTIIIDSNFKPGDSITLAGLTGDVEEIGLRSTRIRTGDGNSLIVPNSELVNSKIINLSAPSREQLCTPELRVAFDMPFEKVHKLVEAVLDKMAAEGKLHPSRTRKVLLKSVHLGYQQVGISFWVQDMDDAANVTSEFLERVMTDVRKAGVPLQIALPAVSNS